MEICLIINELQCENQPYMHVPITLYVYSFETLYRMTCNLQDDLFVAELPTG